MSKFSAQVIFVTSGIVWSAIYLVGWALSGDFDWILNLFSADWHFILWFSWLEAILCLYSLEMTDEMLAP